MIKLSDIQNNLLLEAELERDKQEFQAAFKKMVNQDLAKALDAAADEVEQNPDNLNEEVLYDVAVLLATLLTTNAVTNFTAKISEFLAKKFNFKQGEKFAHKIEHFTHEIEHGVIETISDLIKQFVSEVYPDVAIDTKAKNTINTVSKVLYAIIVIKMAFDYGAQAGVALAKTRWGKGLLSLYKTFVKGREGVHHIKPITTKAARIAKLQALKRKRNKPS